MKTIFIYRNAILVSDDDFVDEESLLRAFCHESGYASELWYRYEATLLSPEDAIVSRVPIEGDAYYLVEDSSRSLQDVKACRTYRLVSYVGSDGVVVSIPPEFCFARSLSSDVLLVSVPEETSSEKIDELQAELDACGVQSLVLRQSVRFMTLQHITEES